MKKLDTLIAEEYKNILEEQHILKSSGPMVLKEWKKSKQILNEEEEKDVSVRYRDEEFGRRKSGEKSKYLEILIMKTDGTLPKKKNYF